MTWHSKKHNWICSFENAKHLPDKHNHCRKHLFVCTTHYNPCIRLASLYIINQPFPSIFMKKKQLIEQEIVYVKILKASNIETKVLSQVKAAIVCHNPYNSKAWILHSNNVTTRLTTHHHQTKKPKPVLDTDSSSIDLMSQTAKFQFTFQSVSTRYTIPAFLIRTEVPVRCSWQVVTRTRCRKASRARPH